ncbi:MAG: DNA-binding response regulator [Chloroflexota bacterium]|nr:MAG: DNA-binding response regulator [Chloroflexota bacterium]HDD62437.1 response regulator transcription factor [Chloroflexota bacterium]
MTGELILLVDDEPNIIELAQLYLEREGYRIITASDGRDALDAVEKQRPALMVLDLMMPEVDGLEVCRTLRGKNDPVAILMLTARDEDIDKILGLELGADDYLTKPFNPRELIARVKAVLRRSSARDEVKSEEQIQIGDILIDPKRREVRIGGQPVEIRTQEFDLLYTLARHPGIVLSRDQLLDLAWGYDYFGNTRTVDVHIGHLRKKLSGSSVKIETVTKIGYKLVQ